MIPLLKRISLEEWDDLYLRLKKGGMIEPAYGGSLRRHVWDGDFRLRKLRFDPSPESLRLWNFLLSEEERLRAAREEGKILVGTMKDLGTVPILVYAFPDMVAFYPDGAWWIPCVMERSAGLLAQADALGLDESFCPVRAMIGAFLSGEHFPIPDVVICSAGATCDDFSAIAQRLENLGQPIFWWEIPHRERPEPGSDSCELPGGLKALPESVSTVKAELERIRDHLESLAGTGLEERTLESSIRSANGIRAILAELRRLVFTAHPAPLPALELMIAEMMALHFCSDVEESRAVLSGLLQRVRNRVATETGFLGPEAVRIFWVNPVADLIVLNLVEDCGGRICGTDYMFTHTLDQIPTNLSPMEALARTALADPMVGSSSDRAERIIRDMRRFESEALVISNIPGASHCALEGKIISEIVRRRLNLPVLEIEVPPVCDSLSPALKTRLSALIESVRQRRRS